MQMNKKDFFTGVVKQEQEYTLTSREVIENMKTLFIGSFIDFSKYFATIEKDLDLLDKYRDLVTQYASLKGRNILVSIEEIVNDFNEIER